VEPGEAYYNTTFGEFILPYQAVQQSEEPNEKLLEFLNSTYHTGANLAKWDREILEVE
jgi:spore cortex formation protein SpoVR/YcgB (stage V sporulation)